LEFYEMLYEISGSMLYLESNVRRGQSDRCTQLLLNAAGFRHVTSLGDYKSQNKNNTFTRMYRCAP